MEVESGRVQRVCLGWRLAFVCDAPLPRAWTALGRAGRGDPRSLVAGLLDGIFVVCLALGLLGLSLALPGLVLASVLFPVWKYWKG